MYQLSTIGNLTKKLFTVSEYALFNHFSLPFSLLFCIGIYFAVIFLTLFGPIFFNNLNTCLYNYTLHDLKIELESVLT